VHVCACLRKMCVCVCVSNRVRVYVCVHLCVSMCVRVYVCERERVYARMH
jgi:hypothetical protein